MNLVQPSLREAIQIAGTVFTDLTNLLTLVGAWNNTTGVYGTVRNGFATSGYQVPAGKTLYIRAVQLLMGSITADPTTLIVGYGDTDVGNASTSAPTNATFLGGSASASSFGIMNAISNGPEWSCNIQVPQNKYPFVEIGNPSKGSGRAWLWGYIK